MKQKTVLATILFLICVFGIGSVAESNTVVDIKANGLDDFVRINTVEPLTVTITILSGDNLGKDADWWVAADTPNGWYYYDEGTSRWYKEEFAYWQGPLYDIYFPQTIFHLTRLPIGSYTIYFAVDLMQNGKVDRGTSLFFDKVDVDVVP